MNLPWSPVVFVDIFGSILVLMSAFYSVVLARQWTGKKSDNVFRNYISVSYTHLTLPTN